MRGQFGKEREETMSMSGTYGKERQKSVKKWEPDEEERWTSDRESEAVGRNYDILSIFKFHILIFNKLFLCY